MKLKKISGCLFVVLSLALCSLEGAQNQPNPASRSKIEQENARTQEKFEIMERDEADDTDALAIPFDDSEIEDEEEIDQLEKKNVFSIPSYSPKK